MSSSKTPTFTFQTELIERVLDAPGLPIEHDRDMAHRVVAAVYPNLVEHSQQVRLRGKDLRRILKLADGVLEYDAESKRLYNGVYSPPPPFSEEWASQLRIWLASIEQDEAETRRRGRPENTWEPYLFASGVGLYAALYERDPATTGGQDLEPGPTMRFMIEFIGSGRTICEKYDQNTNPWRRREHNALKKQIKVLLDFEESRPPWHPDPKVPQTLFRPNSYVVYRDIYLAWLRNEAPFSIRRWDDLGQRH